jgi:hypothetical protein
MTPTPREFQDGDRIKLTHMPHDPDPVEVGATGTVKFGAWIIDRWQYLVDWDKPRSLNLVCPPDRAEKI